MSRATDCVNDVRRWWFEQDKHDPPADRRAELVDAKLEDLFEQDYTLAELQSWTMLNPKTERKEKLRRVPVIEVLTDFILETPQVAERTAEYPIYNATKQARAGQARKANEVTLHDVEPAAPSLAQANDLSHPLDLHATLAFYQRNPAKAVDRFKGRGYSAQAITKAVADLDLTRVRECEQCGGAFYAHDLRLRYCNIMRHPLKPAFNYCEYEKMKENGRKSKNVKEKCHV
ncbi:hypothetical protein ABID56_001763 [Alkalibacillus flavidus]|uniref:Uncharacterized protein n=1 Tax=Alkalibacillus flavidus TaxID=546021 RepID=A0ABV2KVP5_9BACI